MTMKYLFFILIDITMYPFLLILYISTQLFGKIKFVPLFYRQNERNTCISEISSGRKR